MSETGEESQETELLEVEIHQSEDGNTPESPPLRQSRSLGDLRIIKPALAWRPAWI